MANTSPPPDPTASPDNGGRTHAFGPLGQFDALIEENRIGWRRTAADIDVLSALTAAQSPLPPLRIDCGLDDTYLEANRELHRELQRAGIAHQYAEGPGGHDWDYWSTTLEHTLRFFGEALHATKDET